MSHPTIRDEVVAAWRGILLRANCRDSLVDALVLELEQAAAGRGVHLPRRPRIDDPNAIALAPKPAPGDAAAGLEAARSQIRPYAGPDTRTDYEPLAQLPDLPEEPECPSP